MRSTTLSIIVLAALFIGSAYAAQTYQEQLYALVAGHAVVGMLIYIGLAALTTVVAPLSSAPLIPLAGSVWGPIATAIASIIGWLLGSVIAFMLARKYGKSIVERLAPNADLDAWQKRIPERNLFWTIVLLRMAVPVDALSYALGLFTSVSPLKYTLATLIGITPFAFVWAYVGVLPLSTQLTIGAVGLVVALVVVAKPLGLWKSAGGKS
jgi:uncharacterized membrane protein YdjX (TVP38/TMEM64 family)